MDKTIGTQLNDIRQHIEEIESEIQSLDWENVSYRIHGEAGALLETFYAQEEAIERGSIVAPSAETPASWVGIEVHAGNVSLVSFGGGTEFHRMKLDDSQARALRDCLNSADLGD